MITTSRPDSDGIMFGEGARDENRYYLNAGSYIHNRQQLYFLYLSIIYLLAHSSAILIMFALLTDIRLHSKWMSSTKTTAAMQFRLAQFYCVNYTTIILVLDFSFAYKRSFPETLMDYAATQPLDLAKAGMYMETGLQHSFLTETEITKQFHNLLRECILSSYSN